MSTAIQDVKSDCDSFLKREMSGSAISLDIASTCRIYIESDHHTVARMLGWRRAKSLGDVLVYPHFRPDGISSGDVFQVKPEFPIAPGRKYETPKGRRNRVYFPLLPICTEAIRTHGHLLAITEGVKKTLSACQDGVPTIGLAGVENWSGPREKGALGHGVGIRELCDDLLAIDWKDRPVAIMFDTDPRINANVNRASCSLAEALERHGAKVSIFRFPVEFDVVAGEFRKYGIDDWILTKGVRSFREFIDQAIRPPVRNSIERHRDEMRCQRETIRSAPGIFLDRSGTGSGKSYADIVEIPFYKRTLTVVPRHEIGWEVLKKYQEAGIADTAIYPELSTCEKECKRKKCWRFKYGENACVKECCDNYDDVNFALDMGFSASETVCLVCDHRHGCIYKRRLDAVEKAKHIIATNNRFSLSFGSIATPANFVTIHESVLDTLRPDIEIKGKPETITALEAIRNAARGIMDMPVLVETNQAGMDRWCFSWRLREVASEFLNVFATAPEQIQGGRLDAGATDAYTTPKINFNLFSQLRQVDLPKKSGDVLKLCIYATTGALSDCSVKVTEVKRKDGVDRFISIVGILAVSLPDDKVVILNDASANVETLRSATGREIVDITPAGTVENQGRIVQHPVDVTQSTKPEKVLGMLRSLMLQHSDKNKIGIITHQKHLKHVEKHLTEPEKARIVKTDYFRGLASRGSNDWMQCDLLLVVGTPRVPQEAIETALIQAGHPEAISRVLASEKENWGFDYWLGRREDGQAVTVRSRSYYDHHWQQAYRSVVSEELRQCVGRARAVCSDGVPDTVVVSTENLGYPISAESPQVFAEGFFRDTASVLALFFQAQTVVAHRKKGGNYAQSLLNNIIKETLRIIFPILTAKNIAKFLKIKDRTAQLRLQNLSALGLLEKVGERSGWRLSSEHVRKFILIGGGAALESLLQQSTKGESKR